MWRVQAWQGAHTVRPETLWAHERFKARAAARAQRRTQFRARAALACALCGLTVALAMVVYVTISAV